MAIEQQCKDGKCGDSLMVANSVSLGAYIAFGASLVVRCVTLQHHRVPSLATVVSPMLAYLALLAALDCAFPVQSYSNVDSNSHYPAKC